MPRRIRAGWIALPLMLLAVLVVVPSAQAAFSLTSPSAAPSSTQAGAHSNFSLSVGFGGDEDVRNLVTELPPGLVGNPQAAGFCVPSQLQAGACPPNSVIGNASSSVTATVADLNPLPIMLDLPLTATGEVYNMIPEGNDPATLGIRLSALNAPPVVSSAPVILIGHASARSSDFGLNTTILDIPRTASVTFLPLLGGSAVTQESQIHINSTSLTLRGSNPQFMTNPTSCGTKTTRIIATSWDGNTVTAEPSWNSTGCENQAFDPNLSVEVDMGKSPDHILNPEVVTEITQGVDQANVRRVEAILPSSLQANNSALNAQCANFPLDPAVPHGCGPNTQVGTAVARTPLLSKPLEGPVYLIQNPGLLPKVGLDLKGPLPARIVGNATPTSDFRLNNVFGDVPPGLPDVPLTSFRLRFGGGKGGLMVAKKNICEQPGQFNATFNSFGGHTKTQNGGPKLAGCAFKKRLQKNRCKGRKLTDVGSRKRDRIRGTRKRDVIDALGGNDKIFGLGGNDLLCGGKGRDKVAGGKGKDRLYGEKGNDLLAGGKGRDFLAGGAGKDRLAGGPGRDRQKQ